MTGAFITWLIRLGDWIRDLTAAGSKRAVSELLEFQQKRAWVIQNGSVIEVRPRPSALVIWSSFITVR